MAVLHDSASAATGASQSQWFSHSNGVGFELMILTALAATENPLTDVALALENEEGSLLATLGKHLEPTSSSCRMIRTLENDINCANFTHGHGHTLSHENQTVL